MLTVVVVVLVILAALLVYSNFGQTSLFSPTRDATGPGMGIETIDTTQEATGPGMGITQ